MTSVMTERVVRKLNVLVRGLFLGLMATFPTLAQNNPDSCTPHDWFLLKEQVAAGRTSLLCKGVIDASLERQVAAEHKLNAVVLKMPHSASSSDALEALANMYFREGRYREALTKLDRKSTRRVGKECRSRPAP